MLSSPKYYSKERLLQESVGGGRGEGGGGESFFVNKVQLIKMKCFSRIMER